MRIRVNSKLKDYNGATLLQEIAKDFAGEYQHDIILASVNGKLTELGKTVSEDSEIEFITTGDKVGMTCYTRGLILLMLRAFYRVCEKDSIESIMVQHSIGRALYCEYAGKTPLDEALLAKVKAEMKSLVERDIPITKRSVKTTDAVKLFKGYGMVHKERLFKYRRTSNTNLYNLDGFDDYFYGYMPASTGILKAFDLMLYDEGFCILCPDVTAPEVPAPFNERRKLFKTLQGADKWGGMIGIETVADLNEQITTGNINDLILVQEAKQEKTIGDIAECIKSRGGVKFVMIAGPSSSGKTTFSHRLSIQLRTLGFKPHPIALDNYFVNREDTPKDEDGNYNFECLEAIDIEAFNADMNALLRGETVDMRVFNFKTGKHEFKGNYLTLDKDDILVIEGIHGLNDKLSYSLPRESKFKIYISALTQLNIDEHNRINTTDGRLLRRMVRDNRTRGTSAKGTIAMWPSVRRGEEENIFPFQEEADFMFNSALIYELSVLKQFAEPLLFQIGPDEPEYLEAKRLLKFLDYFLGITSEDIPHNSIVREFVGGSVFPV